MNGKLNKITATPAEIEQIFGIPRASLAWMRWQGKGPKFFRAGARRVLYRLADVEEWIEGHSQTTHNIEGAHVHP